MHKVYNNFDYNKLQIDQIEYRSIE